MDSEKKMDLDEPVNVDMEPEDALRTLLGEGPGEDASEDPEPDETGSEE